MTYVPVLLLGPAGCVPVTCCLLLTMVDCFVSFLSRTEIFATLLVFVFVVDKLHELLVETNAELLNALVEGLINFFNLGD